MSQDAMWRLSGRELSERVANGEARCVDIVEEHLQRITDTNEYVNALSMVDAERALATARTADKELTEGRPARPLEGVPFSVKANIDWAGVPTDQGVVALAGLIPERDAPPVSAMCAAGAIPVGQSNMPDFAVRWHTDNALHGATINPLDPSLTAGGSSGGAAAACAVGMTPIGLGNDTGGSLRQPAQCCGVVSLRPTPGRVAGVRSVGQLDPGIGVQLFNAEGLIARTVADLRLGYTALSRPYPQDPAYVGAADMERPRRAAIVRSMPGITFDPSVTEALESAAEALADSGWSVDDYDGPDLEAAAELWERIIIADLRFGWANMEQIVGPEIKPMLESFMARVPAESSTSLAEALIWRHEQLRLWADFQSHHPIVIAPVSAALPFAAGEDRSPSEVEAVVRPLRASLAVNLVGRPAAVVQMALRGGGRQAVQAIGPRYGEALCLDVADLLEDHSVPVETVDPAGLVGNS